VARLAARLGAGQAGTLAGVRCRVLPGQGVRWQVIAAPAHRSGPKKP
jgi:hypothetical protein